jgi:transcriptional regulator of acetoin/glycerol metabolism
MALGKTISPADLRLDAAPPPADRRPMTLEQVEQQAIRGALARHEGNVVAAAEELGMSRSALYRHMEKHGL